MNKFNFGPAVEQRLAVGSAIGRGVWDIVLLGFKRRRRANEDALPPFLSRSAAKKPP